MLDNSESGGIRPSGHIKDTINKCILPSKEAHHFPSSIPIDTEISVMEREG